MEVPSAIPGLDTLSPQAFRFIEPVCERDEDNGEQLRQHRFKGRGQAEDRDARHTRKRCDTY